MVVAGGDLDEVGDCQDCTVVRTECIYFNTSDCVGGKSKVCIISVDAFRCWSEI
jgi:hypothetical protein